MAARNRIQHDVRRLMLGVLGASCVLSNVAMAQFQQQGMGGGATPGMSQQAATIPGQFGGPGVTGQPLVQFITNKPITAAAGSQSTFGGSGSSAPGSSALGSSQLGGGGIGGAGGGVGGQFGGQGASPFGAGAFGGGGFGGGGFGGGGFGGGLGGLGGLGGGFGGLGGAGGLGGGLGNRNNRNGTNQMGGNNSGRKGIRTVVRPDIQSEAMASRTVNSAIAAQIETRLERLPLPEKLKHIKAEVKSGILTLTGLVSTDADKRLVERIMKLEPGVNSIQNDLVVRASTAESVKAEPTR